MAKYHKYVFDLDKRELIGDFENMYQNESKENFDSWHQDDTRNILKEHDIRISMDGKGRSIDNICIERFWRTIKYEEIYLNDYRSMSELRYSIDNYIVKYNSRRLHSAIGNKTPNEVYDTAISNLDLENKELLEVA